MSDLEDWLATHNLSAIAQLLEAQDIDMRTLPLLNEEDFKELGLTLGHRRRLRAAVDAMIPTQVQQDPEPSKPLLGERRNVAVLFVDLTGFASISRLLDPEDLRVVVEAFMALVNETVESFGGVLIKQVGDGAVVMFGAPKAHGDDAMRAARAALSILDAVPSLRSPAKKPLSAHAGLALGEVVSGGEHGILGDAVNMAARLADLASDGEILIDPALHNEIEADVETHDLGQRTLKGFEHPISIRLLNGIAINAPVDPVWPLIGRTAELSQILATASAARDTRAGSVFVLRGEPGIGKTRLIEEVERRLGEEGYAVHRGLFLNFGSEASRDALRVVMRGLVGLAEEASSEERAAAAAAMTREEGRGSRFRIAIGDLLDAPPAPELKAVEAALDADAKAEGLFQSLDALVRRSCAQCPRLIVFEDVHWAPDAVLPLLTHLANAVPNDRCIMIMTTRAEGGFLARSRSEQRILASIIDLAPLRESDAEAFARARLTDAPELALACVRRAEGNPLFLEQLLRAATIGSDALPGTLQQVVLSRIDALEPRDRAAIRVASIFGQRFRLDDLHRLIGDTAFDCDALFERGLLKRVGEDCLFGHALLQEGVYSSILKSERRTLHENAAALFEGRDAPLHARHLKKARSAAAGPALLDAARDARARHRHDAAVNLAREAADLPMDDSVRLHLRMLEAQVLSDQGRSRKAAMAWEGALELATSPVDRGRCLLGLAGALRLAGEFDAAYAAAEAAKELLEAHGEPLDRAWVAHLQGNLKFAAGEAAACEEGHALALELAREAGDAEAEAAALGGLADAAIAQGHMKSAHTALMRCVEASRAAELARTEAGYLSITPLTSFFALDFPAADARASEAFEAARCIGHLRADYMTHNSIEYAHFQRADEPACRANLETSNRLLERLGNRAFYAYALEKRANLFLLQNDIAAAREALDEALEVARETSFRLSGPRLLAYRAKLAEIKAEASRFIAEAFTELDDGALGLNALLTTAHMADTALRWGDDRWALTAAASLQALAEADSIAWAHRIARRTKALAAYCNGAPSPEVVQEVTDLRAAAEGLGWRVEMSILDHALEHDGARVNWALPPFDSVMGKARLYG
ncbi:MAG: AAA family ATPase [Pseudomonadota bacterium]